MTSSLAKKLGLKTGQRALILNAPPGFLDDLAPLPDGVELAEAPDGTFDFVHLFATNQAELERLAPAALSAVRPDGLLWMSYPKRSSKVETDLTRDRGWDAIASAGLEGVAQVAINDTWSALRFRPTAQVKRRPRPDG